MRTQGKFFERLVFSVEHYYLMARKAAIGIQGLQDVFQNIVQVPHLNIM